MRAARRRVAVVTDSTAALPPGVAGRWGVTVVPLDVVVDGRRYAEGVSLTPSALVEALRRGAKVSTSQPAPEAFARAYARAAASGAEAVVSVHLSGELSGKVAAAHTAAERAPLPVHVVDSRTAAMALGSAALAAAWTAAGVPPDERFVAPPPRTETLRRSAHGAGGSADWAETESLGRSAHGAGGSVERAETESSGRSAHGWGGSVERAETESPGRSAHGSGGSAERGVPAEATGSSALRRLLDLANPRHLPDDLRHLSDARHLPDLSALRHLPGHLPGSGRRVAAPGPDEVADAARAAASAAHVWFLVDSLEHLRRGGRLSAPAAALGTVLGLRPLLTLSDGRVVVAEKIRTRRAARSRLEAVAVAAAGAHEHVRLVVHHLGEPDVAAELAARLADEIGPRLREVVVAEAGAVLGAHAGPGLLAVVIAPA